MRFRHYSRRHRSTAVNVLLLLALLFAGSFVLQGVAAVLHALAALMFVAVVVVCAAAGAAVLVLAAAFLVPATRQPLLHARDRVIRMLQR